MIENIHWLGHASFKITGEKIIYIDPYKINDGAQKADIILITHDHYDHFSAPDMGKILQVNTVVIGPGDVVRKNTTHDARKMDADDTLKVGDIIIQAVPAYNIAKNFHPKGHSWNGYVITVGGVRIYHAGDTDFIPEMKVIKADIALLPIGGTYTMTAREAAQAANTLKPKIAIPMHYDTIIGTQSDAKRFKELCECEVVILKKEEG
ncbi:MAG: MBL fold metallo-hydrolase [Candidatus Ancaeobacter aquaticus]|nr:MBL fold metallo-hydrolase [Candidatus Ancaeobacter aquaticus]